MISNQLPKSLSWANRFRKYAGNPILRPQGQGYCADAVFNPGAIVHEGRVGLLCRCINMTVPHDTDTWSVSTLGWTWSDDGVNFVMDDQPAIAPEPGSPYRGGFEDPRLVKIEDTYVLTYTGVRGDYHRVETPGMMALSKDLKQWEFLGEILPGRAIAIVNERVDGKYWAYWGNDKDMHLAWTEDLRHWHTTDKLAFSSRPGYFDEQLCESASAPIVTDDGILLFYNGAMNPDSAKAYAFQVLPQYAASIQTTCYATGWALFDRQDPTRLIARCDEPILRPTELYELFGISNYTTFSQGFVEFHEKKFLYYGCADIKIAVAIAE